MRTINLAVVLSAVALMASGIANAEVTSSNKVHNQNLSKRAYAQPLPESAYQKDEGFEGATLVRGEVGEDGSAVDQKQHAQRLNNLSKRPY